MECYYNYLYDHLFYEINLLFSFYVLSVSDCEQSRMSYMMLYWNVPSGFCTVKDVHLTQDLEYYFLCSGACPESATICYSRNAESYVGYRTLECQGTGECLYI